MTATMRDWVQPFATSISAKVSALDLGLDENQRRRLRESISDDIRKCTDCLIPDVSRAALEKATAVGIDLYAMGWHDQHRFDVGRTTFLFEHVVPVGVIREECIESRSESAIIDILMTRSRVAWILRTEDAALTDRGYRHKREPQAYSEVGIDLVPFVGSLNQ